MSDFNKIFELGQYFYNTFEPVVQIIDLANPGEKLASEAMDYIKSVEPKEGKTIILVIAIGASEYFGNNKNGDAFPEEDLKKSCKNFETQFDKDGKINGGALIFKHHKNKLAQGHPWFGIVRKAFYNDKMHRVELLLEVDNEKASDVVNRIKKGEFPAVSMGCLPGDAEILMADYTYKQICEISSGEKIINAEGTISEVDYPHRHKHKGTWYSVETYGHSRDIVKTTEEHPWLVLTKEQLNCRLNPNYKNHNSGVPCKPDTHELKRCKDCPNRLNNYIPIWKNAEELQIGDFVATPILKGETPNKYGKEFAFLAGYYLAEGIMGGGKGNCANGYVTLCCNTEEVDYVINNLPSYTFTKRTDHPSEKNVGLYIRDSFEIGKLLNEHIGHNSHKKRISDEIMHWDIESQKIFLGAYLSGDGGVYKGAAYYSTCNYSLAKQVQMILLRCGVKSSLNINMHKESTIVKKETTEYQIWCGIDTSNILKDYYINPDKFIESKKKNNKRFIAGGYLFSPIIDIVKEDCDEEVYNIAVKSDSYNTDSYITNEICLHNCKIPFDECSICHKKSPKISDYCDHLKYQMGKILPDGKKVYAINGNYDYTKHEKPLNFFDISLRDKPAGDKFTVYNPTYYCSFLSETKGLELFRDTIGVDDGCISNDFFCSFFHTQTYIASLRVVFLSDCSQPLLNS